MFKFVSDNVGGVGTKRKNSHQSCDACKKRHKRCTHTDPRRHHRPLSPGLSSSTSTAAVSELQQSPVQDRGITSLAGNTRGRPQVAEEQAQSQSTASAQPASQSPSRPAGVSQDAYLRFVGDLSPEASFLIGANKESGGDTSRHDAVGVWLGQKPEESSTADEIDPAASSGPRGYLTSQPLGLACLQTLSPHLRKECLAVVPPPYEFKLMADLYFAKFDPIYPIIHGEVLEQHHPMEAVALKQCICLVASVDPSLKRHLRLPHTERILSQVDFRACLAAAVKQSCDMGFIRDMVVLLQVCALMAFYVDRPGCSELSTYYCAQVVHHSQTLGLHLGWPDDGMRREKSRRIFWCVWVVDRLNAATNGRPVLIHSRDMDMRIMASVSEQVSSFRLLIRISELLDETISQYRPHSEAIAQPAADQDLTFEGLVLETQSAEIGDALLASLEIFYLAVIILRSRPKPTTQGQEERSPSTSLQYFCATSIVSIASEEFKTSITFWAALPYAVSLAASVAYKTLRNSSVPYKRKRAYVLFHSSCEVLDELGKGFLSARAMARLATDTLQQVERVTSKRKMAKSQEQSGAGQSTNHINSNPEVMETDRLEHPRTFDSRGTGESFPATMSTSHLLEEPLHHQSVSQPLGAASPYTPTLDATLFSLDPNGNSLNDFLGDAGIFNDFDPSFDLNRIDAVFSANLDPTLQSRPNDLLDMSHFI